MIAAPTFLGTLLLLVLPLVIAVGVLAYAGTQGTGAFQKQGVAWVITAVMVIAAIGIGYGKAHASNAAEPAPDFQPGASPAIESIPPSFQQGATAPNAAAAGYFERDDAGVLSDSTMWALIDRNVRLYERYGVVIGVVTCNYGGDDLYTYALKRAEAEVELGRIEGELKQKLLELRG